MTEASGKPSVQRRERERKIVNEHWPGEPDNIPVRAEQIAVRARLVFGDEVVFAEGVTSRWDTEHVFVELDEHGGERRGGGVWVKPVDVYRRLPTQRQPAK